MVITIITLVISFLGAANALRDLFRSRPSALWCAWAALAIIRFAPVNVPLWSTILFWGVACGLVLAIGYMLPRSISESRVGLGYFAVGAMVGAALGCVAVPSDAGLIPGAVAGTLIGAVAFSRTPGGKQVATPLRRYANYVLAKGVYAVVTVVVLALVFINLVLLAKTL